MLPTAHCLTSSHAQAEAILSQLTSGGIPESDISYVRYGSENEPSAVPAKEVETNTDSPAEKAGGGAAAGVGLMSLVGLTPLLIVAPAVITAGAAIGAGAGTAAALGALGDYGVPEAEHGAYEQTLRGGGALVAVHTEDESELERAETIMEKAGARVYVIRLTKKLT